MWFQPGPHLVPPCGHMWKIRWGPDRNLGTSWAISVRVMVGPFTKFEEKSIFMEELISIENSHLVRNFSVTFSFEIFKSGWSEASGPAGRVF